MVLETEEAPPPSWLKMAPCNTLASVQPNSRSNRWAEKYDSPPFTSRFTRLLHSSSSASASGPRAPVWYMNRLRTPPTSTLPPEKSLRKNCCSPEAFARARPPSCSSNRSGLRNRNSKRAVGRLLSLISSMPGGARSGVHPPAAAVGAQGPGHFNQGELTVGVGQAQLARAGEALGGDSLDLFPGVGEELHVSQMAGVEEQFDLDALDLRRPAIEPAGDQGRFGHDCHGCEPLPFAGCLGSARPGDGPARGGADFQVEFEESLWDAFADR